MPNNAALLTAALTAVLGRGQGVITYEDFLAKKYGEKCYQELDTKALHQSHLVGGLVHLSIIQEPIYYYPHISTPPIKFESSNSSQPYIKLESPDSSQPYIKLENADSPQPYIKLENLDSQPYIKFENSDLSLPYIKYENLDPSQFYMKYENPFLLQIHIKTLFGKITTITAQPTDTILEIKQKYSDKEGFPSELQALIYSGLKLEDGLTLDDYNIQGGAMVHLLQRFHGGGGYNYFFIHPDNLDPSYDYDFTNVHDNGRRYMRGPYEYRRPCGWKRIALKVLGKYENDTWLGAGVSRIGLAQSSPHEWPVSYHGTAHHNANSIAGDGFLFSKGKGFLFGRGIYATPDINVAEKYAQEFGFNGENYKVVFQNRVNPSTLVKISAQETGVGEYWISPKGEDVRPYGVCIKKL